MAKQKKKKYKLILFKLTQIVQYKIQVKYFRKYKMSAKVYKKSSKTKI